MQRSDAPERVYVKLTEGYEHNWYGVVTDECDDAAEYVRADLLFAAEARIATLTAERDEAHDFIEEVRDCSPDIISGRATDPQDDVDDMIAHDVLLSFQSCAEALIGKNPKARVKA